MHITIEFKNGQQLELCFTKIRVTADSVEVFDCEHQITMFRFSEILSFEVDR